jgi:hypothetical protein
LLSAPTLEAIGILRKVSDSAPAKHDGDTAFLLDNSGNIVDSRSY